MMERPDSLPPLMDAAIAAQQIWRLYRQNNGATFSLYHGNLAGLDLYAVSIYNDREIFSPAPVTVERIEAFIRSNLDLLSDPDNSTGIWLEGDENFYDVVVTVEGRQQAVALAQAYNQLAICHLKTLVIEYIARI